MSDEAKLFATEHFHANSIIPKYEAIYSKLINE